MVSENPDLHMSGNVEAGAAHEETTSGMDDILPTMGDDTTEGALGTVESDGMVS
jgi:hypothetical protein